MKNLMLIALAVVLLSLPSLTAYSKFEVLSSDSKSLKFKASFEQSEFVFEEIDYEGKKYLLPNHKDAFYEYDNTGTPIKLIIRKSVTLPKPNGWLGDVQFNILKSNNILGKMAPVPRIAKYNDDATLNFIESANYNSSYEHKIATLSNSGISRNRYVANLDIVVAQFNPKTQKIELNLDIEGHINFAPVAKSNYELFNKLQTNDSFASTINHNETKEWAAICEWDRKKENQNLNNVTTDKNAQTFNSPTVFNTENWVKIEIPESGVYRLTPSELVAAGVPVSNIDLSTIQIFGRDGDNMDRRVTVALQNQLEEQELVLNTNPNGSLESVVFFAAGPSGFEYYSERKGTDREFGHYLNRFSKNNYYFLTWGTQQGKRANAKKLTNKTPDLKPNTYVHRTFFEEELTNSFRIGSGVTYYGRGVFNQPFTTTLHDLDRSGEILYRIAVGHRDRDSQPGTFVISENGEKLGEIFLRGNRDEYVHLIRDEAFYKIPASVIASNNQSSLKFEYRTNFAGIPTGVFDYYAIHYPRSFRAINNELDFHTMPEWNGVVEFNIQGFGNNIYAYEITKADKAKLIQLESSNNGTAVFRTEIQNRPSRFFVSSNLKSARLSKTTWGNLRSTKSNTKMIVVAPTEFMNSARLYKNYRDGTKGEDYVTIVDVNHIFNEFSSGIPDPTGIRDFLANAYHNWDIKPEYVLLWGNGHYDYRGIETNIPNYIPPYEELDYFFTNAYHEADSPSMEDFFARIVGDDKFVDVALGRLTINSDAQGVSVVNKIKHYETQSSLDEWRTRVTLVADDGWAGPNKPYEGDRHVSQSENLGRLFVPRAFSLNKIYTVEFPTVNLPRGRAKPQVNQELINHINTNGCVVLNWIGHGNPQVWAHQNIFVKDITVPSLTNLNKLFFLSAATCDFGKFDSYNITSGAEDLVNSRIGGAIGVLSATRIVYSSGNAALNNNFFDILFKTKSNGEYNTLGEAYFNLKQRMTDANSEMYFLLGDPSLKLNIPEYKVSFEEINDVTLGLTTPVELQGLSSVKLKGSIRNYFDNELSSDFNGTILVTLHDGDIAVDMLDEQGGRFVFSKYGGLLNKSSFRVENGNFEGEFVIPKDISYSDLMGRLFGFAFNNTHTAFAKGYHNNIAIQGLASNSFNDNDGPEIKIFMDQRSFRAGDIVRENPLLIVDLFDETGINSTGAGIGHRIEAWIDNNPVPVDLTNSYRSDLNNNKYGSAERQLSTLTPGIHTVRVRAWDILNNFSIAETYFNVLPASEEVSIREVLFYPNPFVNQTRGEFKHNLSPPFTADINIFTVEGVLVRKISETMISAFVSDFVWDGRDNHGNELPSGTYYFSIAATSLKSEKGVTLSGIAVKVK